MDTGSDNETEEQRLAREKSYYEWLCETENKKQGNLNEGDGYNCKLCNNKGYIYVPLRCLGGYKEAMQICRCEKIRRTIRALNRSGMANVVHDYTFNKYIVTEDWQKIVLEKANNFLSDPGKHWFFFGGQSGCGKSHICTAIAVSLLKRGNEVKYMLWRDEATKLKAMANDAGYGSEIEQYKTVDILYIDDLFKTGRNETQGRQRPTSADINLAFEILNSRIVQKKLTIISSECTLTDLIDIDEALAGRIKQLCGDYCINIALDRSKNYRLK